MNDRFLQIHFLTSFPSALLNRDDAGFAKRIPFGGAVRTRVSSQCLKRHWRTYNGEGALSEMNCEMSLRSRLTFERYIAEPLVEGGVEPKLAEAVTVALASFVLGQSAKARAEAESEENGKSGSVSLQTGQITVLGRPEVAFLLDQAKAICATKPELKALPDVVKKHFKGQEQKNLKALAVAAGLDAALFGRMVTSDILARGDAAVHVAHAFTTHAEASESDYFSAVDDLKREDDAELGSGHIGSVELTSGLFYGYVVVDVPLLVSNMTGCDRKKWAEADRTESADCVRRLARIIATVTPGAKLGSTAPYAYAQMLFAEAGTAQPRSLANAFLRPVSERPDVLANSYRAMACHIEEMDRMYGEKTKRICAGVGEIAPLLATLQQEKPASIDEVAAWLGNRVLGA